MAGATVEATMVRRHRFSVCTFEVSARIFHTKHSALSLAGSVFRVGAGVIHIVIPAKAGIQ